MKINNHRPAGGYLFLRNAAFSPASAFLCNIGFNKSSKRIRHQPAAYLKSVFKMFQIPFAALTFLLFSPCSVVDSCFTATN